MLWNSQCQFTPLWFDTHAASPETVQVAIVEQGVAPGGGAWLGGQLFSAMVVRHLPKRVTLQCQLVVLASLCPTCLPFGNLLLQDNSMSGSSFLEAVMDLFSHP